MKLLRAKFGKLINKNFLNKNNQKQPYKQAEQKSTNGKLI